MPAFAFASGSVITINHGDKSFQVPISMTSGSVQSITVDPDFKSIVLQLDDASGDFLITLPRSLIDSKNDGVDNDFIVTIDNNEVMPVEIKTTDTQREIKIVIPPNSRSVEIVGTSIVPEFPLALLVLAASIMAILLTTKTRFGPHWNSVLS